MNSYRTPKPLAQMTKEERLQFGAQLVKTKDQIQRMRKALAGDLKRKPDRVYDVRVSQDLNEGYIRVAEDLIENGWEIGYDDEMKAAGIARCVRLQEFVLRLMDEQVEEIERKIAEV